MDIFQKKWNHTDIYDPVFVNPSFPVAVENYYLLEEIPNMVKRESLLGFLFGRIHIQSRLNIYFVVPDIHDKIYLMLALSPFPILQLFDLHYSHIHRISSSDKIVIH